MNSKQLKSLRLIFISLIFIIALSGFSYASNIKLPEPSREFYVLDQENILNEGTKSHIIGINKELYEKTNAQIVVAVVSSLDGRSREEFGLELFRKWQIGGKKENNGVLFLIAPSEREVTIQVGYGLEGAITDGTAGEILDRYVVPHFSKGDFDTGILNGFNALVNRVTDEYEIDIKGIETQEDPYGNDESNPLPGILLIGFIAIDIIFFRGFFILLILRTLSRGNRRGGGGGGGFTGGGGFGGSSGGGGSAGGGGAGRSW